MTDALPVVEPSQLSGYLQSKGWRREGSWRGAGVWDLEPSGRLLVPDSYEYQDDGELIQQAIHKLATYEQRQEQEVLLDISEPMVDTQYFRMQPAAAPGTISLPSGLKAVTGVHDLMRTAARATESGPQLLYEGRRSRAVDDFLHRVMLGSARPGSYILTARVPVLPPQPLQPGLWEEKTDDRDQGLRGRQVMLVLEASIRAAHSVAQRVASGQAGAGAFYEHFGQGVSANLCQAIGDLGGYSANRPLDIGFSWARGQPRPEASDPLVFSGSMVAALARAGDELERLAKRGSAQIIGQVETLNLSPGEEPRIRIAGEIRTEAQHVMARRTLWVRVTRVQYDEAIEAQREAWQIQASGRLDPSRGRLEMTPDRFIVVRG